MRRSCVFTTLLLCVSGSIAYAQCTPEWDGSLGVPGLTTGYAAPVIVHDDGMGEALFVGGSFGAIGGTNAKIVGRYDLVSETWARMGNGLTTGNTNGFVAAIAPFDDGSTTRLIVGGFFAGAIGIPGTQSVAAWDGTTWSSIGADFVAPNSIWGMTATDIGDGYRLYLTGGFPAIGGVSAGGIASWDGSSFAKVGNGIGIDGVFAPTGFAVQSWDPGSGDRLYLIGRFNTVDGIPANHVAQFDGTTWSALGAGILSTSSLGGLECTTIFDDGSGEALFVGGGQMRIVGKSGIFNVLKWDGTEWFGVGGTIGTGRITDLAVWDDGSGERLIASGTAMPGINYVASFDGSTWSPLQGGVGGPPTSGNFPSVFGLGYLSDDLVVCGNFTELGPDAIATRGIAVLSSCAGNCAVDLVEDDLLDFFDVQMFLNAFAVQDTIADWNDDTLFDFFDIQAYLADFAAGCP